MRVGAFNAFELPVLILYLLISVLPLLLFWRIFSRAGLPGALALLLLFPGVGLLAASLVLAVADWPALRGRT